MTFNAPVSGSHVVSIGSTPTVEGAHLFKNFAAPIATLLTLGLTACSANGSPEPAPTVTVTATATVTQTVAPSVQPASTLEETPPSSTAQIGMVWASRVDPGRINQPIDSQPTFDGGDGIAVRIENLLYVDTAVSGDLADECADEIRLFGTASDTHCLYVQWSFDVPADYEGDAAGLTPGPLLTPAGRQIDQASITEGVPGAKNVVMSAYYPGGEPGSTLRWEIGSNEGEWEPLQYEVPDSDGFLPLNFD